MNCLAAADYSRPSLGVVIQEFWQSWGTMKRAIEQLNTQLWLSQSEAHENGMCTMSGLPTIRGGNALPTVTVTCSTWN